MIDGFELQLGCLEGSETLLDDTECLVCGSSVLGSEGIVVGLDDPLAIGTCGLLDDMLIEPDVSLLGECQAIRKS